MSAPSQYLAPNPDALKRIRHIVVLMLENRSFDNLLGWLYDGVPVPNGQSFEGLHAGLWNPLDNIDSDGIAFVEKVPVEKNGAPKFRYGKPVPNPPDFTLPRPDPGEGFADTTYQLFQKYQVGQLYPPAPINMGFVQNYQNAMLYGTLTYGDAPTNPREIMITYTPEQVPVLSALARGFAVCDQYHCSVPSQTLPNRSFIHAGTSDGHVNNAPDAMTSSRTIFNQIQEAIDAGRQDLSWRIFGNDLLAASGKKREEDLAGAFAGDHFSLTRLTMTALHDSRFDGNFGTLDEFHASCASGTLPSYAFLEPQFGGTGQNDQHPPADIRPGEQLIADVYNAVRASPAFAETLLVITYDEHGGCYDHYPPQGDAVSPDPGKGPGQQGFLFNRFGVRVPCVLVNPHIPRGVVARPAGYTPYDHTSVIKTIQNCLGLSGELTARSAAAPDFSGVLSLSEARTDSPDVHPLAWEPPGGGDGYGVNSLHRLIATVIARHTGQPMPSDEDLLAYIQEHYNRLFIRRTEGR